MSTLSRLRKYLSENKERIVTRKKVAVNRYSETYGEQPGEEEIEFVDFDKLMNSIDEFTKELKEKAKKEA